MRRIHVKCDMYFLFYRKERIEDAKVAEIYVVDINTFVFLCEKLLHSFAVKSKRLERIFTAKSAKQTQRAQRYKLWTLKSLYSFAVKNKRQFYRKGYKSRICSLHRI